MTPCRYSFTIEKKEASHCQLSLSRRLSPALPEPFVTSAPAQRTAAYWRISFSCSCTAKKGTFVHITFLFASILMLCLIAVEFRKMINLDLELRMSKGTGVLYHGFSPLIRIDTSRFCHVVRCISLYQSVAVLISVPERVLHIIHLNFYSFTQFKMFFFFNFV